MGKHEREDVYIAETIVNDMLNGETIDQARKRHEFYRYADVLTHRIKDDFPMMKRSHHIGNVYGTSIGDIKLDLASKETVYLELKFLASGSGTRASIGQNSMTDHNLFEGENILSWSDFRKNKNHIGWVINELEKFPTYPRSILRASGNSAVYKKASYLKEVLGIANENTRTIAEAVLRDGSADRDEMTSARIILEIMNKDHNEKLEYIEYLKSLKQKPDNIKKFVFLILSGAHTKESLDLQWSNDLSDIIATLRNTYFVYYLYKGTLITKVEDFSIKLKNLIGREIYISFSNNQTNLLLSFKADNGNERPILRVVFHWKNKFQGIQTPCLHIFDENYLK